MRRFVFKFESVLEQRRHVERMRQRAVADAQRLMLELERDINQAAVAEKSGSSHLRGRLDPRTLAIEVRFSQVMRQKISMLREQLESARRDLALAQAGLVEATNQRKALEKFEEKQRASWMTKHQKQETEAHDELAQRNGSGPNESAENFPPYAP